MFQGGREFSGHRSAGDDAEAVLAPSLWFCVCLGLFVVLCLGFGVWVGRVGWNWGGDPVLLSLRVNRTIVALLCGGGLSVAGVVVQTLFRNPLASPEVLGTTSGATLGAHVALLICVFALGGGGAFGIQPEMLIPLGATLGACGSLAVLLGIVSLHEGSLSLLLTGFALMMLFEGTSSFLTSVSQEAWELNRAFNALSLGDISASGMHQVLLVAVMTLGGVAPIFLYAGTLDVLLSGDEEACTLGVDVRQVRFWLVLWVALLTAGAVAVGGGVGFVGLIVPHALRPYVGQRHRFLLPSAFTGGGGFVVLCDVLCRIAPLRTAIPLGILTDMIGAPIFLHMLLRHMREREMHG